MNKQLFLVIGFFFSLNTNSFGQSAKTKMLFVIDSIPLLKDPEEWNQLLEEEISDVHVVTGKDSLKILGLDKFQGVTYIFTKEFRARPDSVKEIPSLKQMEFKNEVWNLNGLPYSGKYIDYFNNGKILNEGILSDGILNGELKIYHKSGSLFKQSFFINGKNTGTEISYFQSGKVRGRMKYAAGKSSRSQQFFPNGQLAYDYLDDGLDTLVSYYSTGKIKKIDIRKNGVVAKNPITEQINYYQNFVYQSSRDGDFKTGLKYCNKILQLDSVNETAYFYKGEFLEKQNRLEEAIIQYDKAISIEPLLHYALIKRAFARIKKYESGGSTNTVIASGTNPFIPANEVEKICADLQLAVYCDVSEKRIADALVKYCRTKSSR